MDSPTIFVTTKKEDAMGVEIERKFLVKEGFKPSEAEQITMKQAYLCAEPERTVRVRVAETTATSRWVISKRCCDCITRCELE